MKRFDITAYPIMEVGTWNKMEFTVEDLDSIVRAHEELVDGMKIHRVPLKIGHNDEQALTDGQPAMGWVHNVRRIGDQLLADFSDMPKVIKKCIEQKRYTSVSIELLMGLKRGDKDYKFVLDAVAILGAEHPAVHSLPDLNAYLAKRSLGDEGGRRVVFSRQVERVKFSQPRNNHGGPAMDEEEKRERQALIDSAVLAAISPYKAEIKSLQESLSEYKRKFSEEEDKRIKAETEFKGIKAKFDEADITAKRAKVTMARTEVKAVFEEAVKGKHITPAQRDADYALTGIESNDEAVLKMHEQIDVLRVRLMGDKKPADKTQKFNREEQSQARGGSEDDGRPQRVLKDPGAEISRRAKILMSRDSKKSYKDATREVYAEDPELHAEYVNTEPPMRAAAGGEA